MKQILIYSLIPLILGGVGGYYWSGSKLSKEVQVIEKCSVEQSVTDFFSKPTIGRIKVNLDTKYNRTIVDAEPIWSLPEPPTADLPIGNMKGLKTFDINEGYGDVPLYTDWKESKFDIDHDGVPEKIYINSLGMTSQPHLIRIAKNNKVIFEYTGSVVGIEEAYGNNPYRKESTFEPGFIITTQIWQDQNGIKVRYVIKEDGSIVPLWQQRHTGIKF